MLKDTTLRPYYGLPPYKGDVGIEIEMEGEFLPTANSGSWHAKTDGSLRAGGIEYVTRGPINKEDIEYVLGLLWSQFKKAGAVLKPSDRCGVHIHLNCQNYTFEEIWRIATLSLMLEDILLEFCGEARNGNLFCLNTRDGSGLLLQLVQDREAGGRFETLNSPGHFKYAFLNFSVLPMYGSLEYRSLQTEKDYDNILTWTEMILAIKDYALSHDSLPHIISNISMHGIDNFLLDIFGKKNAKILRETNPHYTHIILENIRRIQILAYSKIKEPTEEAKTANEMLLGLRDRARPAGTAIRWSTGTATNDPWREVDYDDDPPNLDDLDDEEEEEEQQDEDDGTF